MSHAGKKITAEPLGVKEERMLKYLISFERGNAIVGRESKREGAHFAKVGDCGPRLKKR